MPVLSNFLTRISARLGAASLTPDNMPDSLARAGSYTVKGNENCVVPQPDLALAPRDIGTYQFKGQGGKQVVVAAEVHNNGTADASGVVVQFAMDGQTFATQTIARIAKGSFVRVAAGWNSKGQKRNRGVRHRGCGTEACLVQGVSELRRVRIN